MTEPGYQKVTSKNQVMITLCYSRVDDPEFILLSLSFSTDSWSPFTSHFQPIVQLIIH